MMDKQKCTIKLAIYTMDEHFDNHCNTSYVNRETDLATVSITTITNY